MEKILLFSLIISNLFFIYKEKSMVFMDFFHSLLLWGDLTREKSCDTLAPKERERKWKEA